MVISAGAQQNSCRLSYATLNIHERVDWWTGPRSFVGLYRCFVMRSHRKCRVSNRRQTKYCHPHSEELIMTEKSKDVSTSTHKHNNRDGSVENLPHLGSLRISYLHLILSFCVPLLHINIPHYIWYYCSIIMFCFLSYLSCVPTVLRGFINMSITIEPS